MMQIVLPIAIFTAIVLLLSAGVLIARQWLAPSGPVTIGVNRRQQLRAEAGDKLLWTLAGLGIYLPAACGGRGTCGQCRVTVTTGSGPLLPTERAHITRDEAARGAHLACMVTVRADMEIAVPAEFLQTRRWICTVHSNRNVSTLLKELVLTLPEGEQIDFEAGDYVLLEAPPHRIRFEDFEIDEAYRGEWERLRLTELRSSSSETVVRGYSLANPPAENTAVTLVVRIALPPADAPPGSPPGKASSYIFGLEPGDAVTISGPFGEFHVLDGDGEIVLISGGAGIAPMRSIVFDQLLRARTGRKISLWYGARNVRELCYQEDFDRMAQEHSNFSWHAALSEHASGDDWHGHTGLIHNVVRENYLRHHPSPGEIEYYLCGPPLMSAAVTQMLEDLGVEPARILFDDFGQS